MWDSEQRTTLQSTLRGDTDCGRRQQATPSLRFCFPLFSLQKRFPHLAFWLFWFCVCGSRLLSRLTATSLLPDLANSLRYMCSVQRKETLETAADVHLSIVRLSKLTKRNFSWRLKTQSDPCDHSATSCIKICSVFPKYLRQTPLDRHRLPTDSSLSDLSPII